MSIRFRRAAGLAAGFLLGLSLAARASAVYATSQSAILPVGQPNLSFNGVNGTPGVAAAGLSTPGAAWSDGSVLIIADTANNRVLVYNTLPTGNGVAADLIIGQPDAVSNSANQGGGAPGANTLSAPTGVFFDSVTANLYITDQGNNRVLIYNTLPLDNNTPADTVVGQANMTSGGANQGGVSSGTLSGPSAVYSDGTALYIADKGNNRVLIYNTIPGLGVNGAFADVVVGQTNGITTSANQGGAPTGKTLSAPSGVYAGAGKLLISDQNNNRVLIYNAPLIVNNSSANVVIGQILLTSAAVNQGGVLKANTLSSPAGVYSDGVKIIVPDSNNNRVLIYNAIPSLNNASAAVAVGQPNMTSGNPNQGKSAPAAGTLSRPASAISDGTNLYVADQLNNRVLLYQPLPAANGAAASLAQGQANLTSGVANQATSGAAANTLFRPAAMDSNGSKLLIADRFNNRVLIFNSLPSAANASADFVVGQVLMSSANSNQGGAVAAADTLSFPGSARFAGAKLVVTDQSNNRVLIYNSIPAVNNSSANVVVGQATMIGRTPNQGGISAASLFLPADAASDGTRLFVADRQNSRVLIYNPIPAANGTSAGFVVGQSLMSTGSSNQGGAASASTLSLPAGVFSTGTILFIADQNNNRVLIYNPIPTANNTPANFVIGQANMISTTSNRGGAPAANTLSRPASVYSDGTALYIADQGNNRVLIYNTIPTANNASADVVLGQAALNANGSNMGGDPASNTLSAPTSVFSDSMTGRMFIADSNNNRVLLDLPAISTTIAPAGGGLTLNAPPVSSFLEAAVGALAQPTYAILGAGAAFPSAPSPAGPLKASGVGVQIVMNPPIQPTGSVTLSVAYNPVNVAGLDRSKLILARYDASANLWVPLPSASDTANNRVVAQIDHFSLYQVMQADPSGNTLATIKVYPNPLMPSAGQTTMTFAQLPPNSRLRVYTLSGALIKDLSADATGIARWDATNQSGVKVASGVYFVYLQGGGDGRAVKVAVQR